MSTIQQDMTDAAVVWEHLAKRMANELGDGSEEAWNQATQIHAAATILHGWVDERKEKLRAAVDDDAPQFLGHVHPHDFEEWVGKGTMTSVVPGSIADRIRKTGTVEDDAPKQCTYFDCGHCYHTEGPSHGCTGWGNCDWFTPER